MTRPVEERTCDTCGKPLLAGIDGDACASYARADPTPIGPIGEALALCAGRATYYLRVDRNVLRLDRRDRWQIKGQPAGSIDRVFPYDVIAEHRCGSPPLPGIPSNLTFARSVTQPTPRKKEPDAQPCLF